MRVVQSAVRVIVVPTVVNTQGRSLSRVTSRALIVGVEAREEPLGVGPADGSQATSSAAPERMTVAHRLTVLPLVRCGFMGRSPPLTVCEYPPSPNYGFWKS